MSEPRAKILAQPMLSIAATRQDFAWPVPGIGYGADYNPEQWPRKTWAKDAELMAAAGVNFATVGVFSWALLEPEPGHFDFVWMDEVLGHLDKHGIKAVLATATASPPPWLSDLHPEILPVDARGTTLSTGSRQAYCPSSDVFRGYALRLVRALAEHYADHPALALWHVNNELGCHVARCYCPESRASFHQWLRAKYSSIDALNDAWGTAFWSQRYRNFNEIELPGRTPAFGNPTQVLDFDRFSSDALIDLHVAELHVLREVTPHVPVTTNFMTNPDFTGIDYWSLARHQDIVSTDHYLVHTPPAGGSSANAAAAEAAGAAMQIASEADLRATLAFSSDLTRSLAMGRPWWLMEHSPSAVNWQSINVAKAPGELKRTSLAHLGRGADAIGFFQWKASKAGAEKFHSAMYPHAGEDTKVWREVCDLGATLKRLEELAGTEVASDIAIMLDWDSRWALDQPTRPSEALGGWSAAVAAHRAFWDAGYTVDFLPATARWVKRALRRDRKYQLIVVPSVYLMDDATAAALEEFTASGGTVLVTYFSGICDENDHVRLGGYPGALRDLLGIRTEEFFPLVPGQAAHIQATALNPELDTELDTVLGAEPVPVHTWSELTHLHTATAWARFTDTALAGSPAITKNTHGAGTAWFQGTALPAATHAAFAAHVAQQAGCAAPVLPGTPGAEVEAIRRISSQSGPGEQSEYVTLVNHSCNDANLGLSGYDLVSETEFTGTLSAGSVAVLRVTAGPQP